MIVVSRQGLPVHVQHCCCLGCEAPCMEKKNCSVVAVCVCFSVVRVQGTHYVLSKRFMYGIV